MCCVLILNDVCVCVCVCVCVYASQFRLASAPKCNVIAIELGGVTLTPGCYSPLASAAFDITGTLTLSGSGQFTFIAPAAVNTAANRYRAVQCSWTRVRVLVLVLAAYSA